MLEKIYAVGRDHKFDCSYIKHNFLKCVEIQDYRTDRDKRCIDMYNSYLKCKSKLPFISFKPVSC